LCHSSGCLKILMTKKWLFILVKDIWNHCDQNQNCYYSTLLIMRRLKIYLLRLYRRTIENLNPELSSLELMEILRFWKWLFKIAYNTSVRFRWSTWKPCDGTIIFWGPTTENILYFSTHENNFRKIQRKTHLSSTKDYPFAHYRYV
jgi:hypothetical protein